MARSSVRACRTVQPAERRRWLRRFDSRRTSPAWPRLVGWTLMVNGQYSRASKCATAKTVRCSSHRLAMWPSGRGWPGARADTSAASDAGPLTSRRSVMGSSSREQACGLNRFSFCDARSRAGTLVGCSGMDLPGHVSGLLRGFDMSTLRRVRSGGRRGGRRWLLGGRCPRSL